MIFSIILRTLPSHETSIHGFHLRPTSITYGDGSTVTYEYDSIGRLQRITDSSAGTIDWVYDALNRIIQEITPQGSVSYQYDAIGRRTQMVVNGQTPVTYQYDAADRLTRVEQGSVWVAMTYDVNDRRTSLTYSNGTTTTYTYDHASQVTAITHTGPSGLINQVSYTYDVAGNQTSGTRTNGAGAVLPTAVSAASYDAANQQTTFNGATLTYDAKGFLTSNGTNTYQWDARDRLIGISGGVTAAFSYDALGRRTSKTVNGRTTQFIYDGSDIVAEIDSQEGLVTYLRGLSIDEPFIRQTSSVNEFYHADVQGSAVVLSDSAGTPTTTYTYDPFGKTTVTGLSTNAFQYTGRENDDTGLYYYRARYYSPTLQRFLSEDPIGFAGGDPNLYAYVGNSPVRYRDPLGLWGVGISVEGTIVTPFSSGGGGTGGINLQYTSDNGLGLYAYRPASEPSSGLAAGGAIQLNVARGNGAWSGNFTNYEGNIGPYNGGYFRSSDLNAGDTLGGRKPPEGYEGFSFGWGPGGPAGASETTTTYEQFNPLDIIQDLFNDLFN